MMTNTKVTKMTRAERIKALSVPSELRTIKVEMKSEGGRIVYVSTPQKARIMETADRIMRRSEVAQARAEAPPWRRFSAKRPEGPRGRGLGRL